MHVSVEILGGYKEAKHLHLSNAKTVYIPQYGWHLELDRYDMVGVLLEYRKQQGFFEENDVAVFKDEAKPNSIFRVCAINEETVDLADIDSNLIAYQSMSIHELRHADIIEQHKKKRA